MPSRFIVGIYSLRAFSAILGQPHHIFAHLFQQAKEMTLPRMAVKLYASDGLLGFYNGLSASILRQLTYTTARFGVYETVKKQMAIANKEGGSGVAAAPMPFYQKVFLSGISGAVGGLVGSPADLINVRMQNDVKLAPELRRNYRHALDGLVRICRYVNMVF